MSKTYRAPGIDAPESDLSGARGYDGVALLLVGALMTLGAVMGYSVAMTADAGRIDWRHLLDSPIKQCFFSLLGFGVMLWTARLDYRLWAWERRGEGWASGSLYLIAVMLLAVMLVLSLGDSDSTVRRSIPLPGVPGRLGFQPAEFAKLAMVVWLAALLTRPDCETRSFKRCLGPTLILLGLIGGLVGIQDLGTAVLMGAVAMAVLLMAGVNWPQLLAAAVVGGGGAAWMLIKLFPYRWERLTTFFSDNPDPSGAAYQVNQSLIAIGYGGWFGRGLGAGVHKLGYVPKCENDFIFAVVCEELGVVGGLFVIALFVLLLWRGWWISRRADTPFGRLLAAGITLMICLQAAFNIGVATNCVPTKGISLPFVSAGGSGMLFLGAAAGLLASVGGRVVVAKKYD